MRSIWHDLECGSYTEDLAVWQALARRTGGPVLDVGAGTGRIALELARAGYAVTALDLHEDLLATLRERAGELDVTTVAADARSFSLETRFPLCVVPMQTIQLLGGAAGRAGFLRCAGEHLTPGGVLAIALAGELELFETSEQLLGPLPDVREIDGIVYSSLPTAVRPAAGGDGYVLVRRRETVSPDGKLSEEQDLINLDHLDADALEAEAEAFGLHAGERLEIAQTDDYVASTVVVLHA